MRLALLLATVAVLGAAPAVPRPVEVGPAPDAAGTLALAPSTVTLEVAAGAGGAPVVTLTNGDDASVTLDLAVRNVRAGAQGRPRPAPATEQPTPAAAWTRLPTDRVTLGPDERARFAPAVNVPRGASPGTYPAALVARTTDRVPPAEVVAPMVVTVPGDEPVAVEAAATLTASGGDATARVEVATAATSARLVRGRLRVRDWLGRTVAETEVPSLLVLAGTTRTVEVGFRSGVVGPHRLDVLVGDEGTTATASTTRWLWPRDALLLVAAVLVAVSGAALALVRHRRARDGPPPAAGARGA